MSDLAQEHLSFFGSKSSKSVRSSTPAQTAISTNARILRLKSCRQTKPEQEMRSKGSAEAHTHTAFVRLRAYLACNPQKLLHEQVKHTRLATKATPVDPA